MVYPSGQAVEWEYQDGGTLQEVGDGTRAIFSNLAYAAHGAVAGMRSATRPRAGGLGAGVRPGAALAGADRGGDDIGDGNTHRQRRQVLFGLDYDNYETNGNIAAVTRTLPPGRQRDPVHHGFRLQLRPAEPAGGVRRGGCGVYLCHGRVREHHRAYAGRQGRRPNAHDPEPGRVRGTNQLTEAGYY